MNDTETEATLLRAWLKYKALKPVEKYHDQHGRETTYTFQDWVKETA